VVGSFVPVGGPVVAGVTHPAFTAGVYAVRRAALEDLGGFSPDASDDDADHELLNRVVAAGRHVEIIPQPLAVKRRPDRWTTLREVWPHLTVDPPYDTEQCARAIRPIAQMPGADPDLLGLILGGRSEQALAAAALREQQQAYEARVAGYGEWVATLERHAGEYRQWLEDLEATTAELRASCADYARDNEELRARARARSLRVGPLLRRLRKLLD
jgi:hypothetical protein